MARPTLRTLARELDLTVGTVSRALNGYADISAATRTRVREAAARVGYDPNPIARRLATGTAEAVAYLLPGGPAPISDSFTVALLDGLGETLAARGWDLVLARDGDEGSGAATLERLARSGRVAGVALSRPHRHDGRIEALRRSGLPFVVHGRSADCDDYAWFDVDGRAAFAAAVDHLVGLGHARIGYVGGPTYYQFAAERLEGYREGLAANGIAADDALIHATDLSDVGGERATADLLGAVDPPTALACVTDIVALGALTAVRARGLVPGRDVSVIGYDGLGIGRHAAPPLTTMTQPQADAGRRIGEMLLAVIEGGEPRDHQVLRRASLLRRGSDGPAPDPVRDAPVRGTAPVGTSA